MDGKTAQRLAAKIADYIMTPGVKSLPKADRLVLFSVDGDGKIDRNLGGWAESPLARHIEKILLEEPMTTTIRSPVSSPVCSPMELRH